jgi:putative ABC transport system permease protein
MGRYLRVVGIGFSGAASNPVRAALTMLGIIIGVAAVIVLTSLGNGVQNSISGEIEGLGTNLVQISPGSGSEGGGSPFGAAPASTLTLDDADKVDGLDSVERASATAGAVARIQSESGEADGSDNSASGQEGQSGGVPGGSGQAFTGVSQSYDEITPVDLAAGSFIEGEDEAVLAKSAARDSLDAAPEEALGKTVTIGGQELKVVGVSAPQGGGEGFGPPGGGSATSYIPVATAMEISGTENVGQIVAQAESSGAVGAAEDAIKSTLTEAHGGTEDFSVFTQEELLSTFTQITDQLNVFLAGIAGISLLVGGIGIMNIMLVSVTERTREIGIRKAVGAKDSDILIQFLSEALLLSLVGGLLGISLGIAGGVILPQLIADLPAAVFSLPQILLAFGVAGVIGLVFGVLPAYRSARLAPVQALGRE